MLQYFMTCEHDVAAIYMLSLLQCEHDIVYRDFLLHAGVIAGAAAACVCIACVDNRYAQWFSFAFAAFAACGRYVIRELV